MLRIIPIIFLFLSSCVSNVSSLYKETNDVSLYLDSLSRADNIEYNYKDWNYVLFASSDSIMVKQYQNVFLSKKKKVFISVIEVNDSSFILKYLKK